MFRSDAFLLAELAGCMTEIAGPGHDLSRASDALRPLAERLLAADFRERQAIWDEFLARANRPVVATAMAPATAESRLDLVDEDAMPCGAQVDESAGSAQKPAPLAAEPAARAAESAVPMKEPPVPASPPPEPTVPRPGLRMTCVRQLQPRPVEWLWANRVPLGMITMFAGDPKLGKSFVTLVEHRVLGSIAYVGACRANFLFLPDQKDQSRRRVLMFDNGGNLAPPAPALAYTIEARNPLGPQVVWSDDHVTVTVEEALRANMEPAAGDDYRELTDCEKWLKESLAAGRIPALELRRAGKDAGFGWPMLHRARARIGAVAQREGFGPGSKSYWQLRDQAKMTPTSTTDLTPLPSAP